MCNTNIANITSLIYLIITFGVPIFFFIIYHVKYNDNRAKTIDEHTQIIEEKDYVKPALIAFIIFAFFISFKIIFSLNIDSFKCINCYINNDCKVVENKKDGEKNKKTTTTSSTTTTTTTTTTTKKIEKHYDKVAEIDGERLDIGKTSKDYDIYEINGVTYVDGYLIANKTYYLPSDFVPTNTYKKADGNSTKQCATCIDKLAYQAFQEMDADAAALNLNLWISSGFRSYLTQSNIYNRNVKNNGQAKADTFSARPGSSEHQTGLAFDLNTIDDAFGKSDAGKWVNQNCYKYGFIIRYPDGKTDETGYIYESWHLRYVGTDLSYKLYNNGDWITMEDYFGITSMYLD